jgi:hypothetical protein
VVGNSQAFGFRHPANGKAPFDSSFRRNKPMPATFCRTSLLEKPRL